MEVKEHVWVHKTAHVFESAYLGAPCIIGPKRKCVIVPLFVVVLWLGQIVLLEIVWN